MGYAFRTYALGGPITVTENSDPSGDSLASSTINCMRDQAFYHRGEAIVYQTRTGTVKDHAAGTITPTYTDTAISKAIVGPVKEANTRYRMVRIRLSDLAQFPPKDTDRIVINGVTWNVTEHSEGNTEYTTSIRVEKP